MQPFRASAPLEQLPKPDFIRAWCAVAYTFPGLHPDGYEDAESGWPRALRRFAAEAWRRVDAGELTEEELCPCDAQGAGSTTVCTRTRMMKSRVVFASLPTAASPPCGAAKFCRRCRMMSASDATAEIFFMAFKALKPKEREAVWQKMVGDRKLAEDLADTLALEARRGQPTESLGEVLEKLKIRV